MYFLKNLKLHTGSKLIAYIFILFLTLQNYLPAQKHNIRFEHLNTEDGLSNSSVSSILQDSQGFVWFATDDGLNRYDGYNFKIYYHKDDDKHSLPGNRLRTIYEDSKNRLWIGGTNGLSYYDKINDKFYNYLLNEYVRYITEDAAGILWLGTNNGFYAFNPETKEINNYQLNGINNNDKSNVVICVKVDHKGIIWMGTDGGGVFSFNRTKNEFKNFTIDNSRNSISHNIVLSIFEDSKNRLWFGTKLGLNRFDRTKNNFVQYHKSKYGVYENLIFSITQDNEGILWIGSYEGISRFNPENKSSVNYTNQKNNKYSLSTKLIRNIYISNNNIFWIGTRDGGINKFDKKKEAFIIYDSYGSNNLSTNNISCISEDKAGNVWFGTKDRGIYKYDILKKTFTNFSHNPNNPVSLGENNILSIWVDSEDIVWVGTYGAGLNKLNKRTSNFKKYKNDPGNPLSISNNIIQNLFEDSRGNLWVGTDDGGLNRFDKKSETFTRFNSNIGNTILVIYEDSKKNIWVGSNDNTLSKFDYQSGTFINYLNKIQNESKINAGRVYTLKEDSKNNLWLGTDAGLIKYNPVKKTLSQYTLFEGSPSNNIYGILIDNQDNIWSSTMRGLYKFSPDKNVIKKYDADNGLQSNEFNLNGYYKGNSGKFYFGGPNGFNEFYPDKIKDNNVIPPVAITDFLVFDKTVPVKDSTYLKRSIIYTDEIILDYTDYIFSFEFSSLNFTQPAKNKFKYKLEGFDKDWVIADNRIRKATYTNIPHGEYNFKVIASNNDGYWNNEGASIKIIILPPFWETWWFYSLMLLIIIAILYSIYRYRINKILELERLRVGIASDLHDDIGATLTKLALKADMIQHGLDTEDKTTGLKRISEMSRQAVGTMSDIVWSIDSRNDTYESMINKMKDFAFSILADKEIKVEFNTSGFNESEKVPIELRQNLYLIFKEAINNIAKHSNAKAVKINFTTNEKEFILSIFDNCTNFKEKEFHVGHGLKNMKMRAKKINAEIEYKNENGFMVVVTGKLTQ